MKLVDFGISMLVQEERGSPSALLPANTAVISVNLRASEDRGPSALLPTLQAVGSSVADPPGSAPNGMSIEPPLLHAGSDRKRRPASVPSGERQLTKTGVIMGTPIYMAPELLLGSKYAQPAADVFSLGVLAFEMFTGQPPFAQPPILIHSLGGVLVITPLLRNKPGLDSTMVALIERCLATEPERRPNAKELASALYPPAVAGAA